MFVEMTRSLPDHLSDFGMDLSPEKLRAAASEKSARQLIDAAEGALAEPWSTILASDYREYSINGNRSRFEALYFSRRLKLNALVVGECIEGQGRFLAAITDGLWLICEESGWQLPAHNSHIRGGSRAPLPDPQNPVIDLFAAETGTNLALTLHLLDPQLDNILVQRVRAEIQFRITRPYLTRHFWWMGNGDERMNNWTAWITQNVLLSTFLLPTDQSVRRTVCQNALISLDAFQKDYGDDGACEEGVLYYGHAALCMFGAMTVLDTAAPDTMTPLFAHTKIRNMAEFIHNMHVCDNTYFNFADAPARYKTSGVREYLLGKAVSSASLQAFAAQRWNQSSDPLMKTEWNLWYRVLAILAEKELRGATFPDPQKRDILYPGIQLAIVRDDVFDLAVKGGNNGESHNHNDVGSFTLYKNGQPFIIDVGVETYTAKTFSAERYDIWTMQSAYHNLPTFDGVMQAAGEAFGAKDFQAQFLDETAQISMDLAAAYPVDSAIEYYRRSVTLVRNKHVEIFDNYEGKHDAVLSLMTVARPIISEKTVTLDGLGTLSLEGAGQITIDTIAITDDRLRQSWPDTLYRILVPLRARQLRMTIN